MTSKQDLNPVFTLLEPYINYSKLRSLFILSIVFILRSLEHKIDLVQMTSSNGDNKGLVVSFGEMLIDFVPTESGVSLSESSGFLKAPGGAPANVAIAVSRLGGRAAFVGKLGDDEFGHMLAGILRKNDVDDQGINFDKGARTALAFVTLRSDGEREFMFYRNPSADMLLRPDELNLEIIRSVRKIFLFVFKIVTRSIFLFITFFSYKVF